MAGARAKAGGVSIVVPFIDHMGGMEAVAWAQAGRFAADGIATLLLSCYHCRGAYRVSRLQPPAGVDLVRLPVLQRRPLLDLTWVWPGARLLAARGARAVIAHQLPTSGVLAARARRLGGPPFAIVTHGSGVEGDVALLRSMPWSRRRVAAVNRASVVTALNAEVESELGEVGVRAELVRRVPNGCDTERFGAASAEQRAASRAALGVARDATLLVYTGRLSAGKRLGLLVDAAVAARRELPGLRVRIAGVGPEAGRLARLIAERELQGCVELVGRLADVRPLLHAADLFALPSVSEGMSMALLEAMSCGLGVVVSDAAGNRAVVTDGVDGCIVGEPTPAAWSAAIRRAAAARQHLGEAASTTVRQRFSRAAVDRFYLDWYREVAGIGPASGGAAGSDQAFGRPGA